MDLKIIFAEIASSTSPEREARGRAIEELDTEREEVLLGLLALRAAMSAAGGTR